VPRCVPAVALGGCTRRIHFLASFIVGISALAPSQAAHADDSVTYDVFSDIVPIATGIEYRDVSGKHLLQSVPLPFRMTVAVSDAFSSTNVGPELRADWRPYFRTGATVGRGLDGQYVTVRITFRDKIICESRLDVGNATCYGGVPHNPETSSSYDHGPLFPEQPGFLP